MLSLVHSRPKEFLAGALANFRSWRTQRKLLVIESDDWGSIRTPNRQAFDSMVSRGLEIDNSPYNRLDGLESSQDLESLFEVLGKHIDGRGRPAVMTFNTVMGNPDFDGIRHDNFEVFHHENLFVSYVRYRGEDLRSLWMSALEEGLIRPQFHAREHLNTRLWLRDLRDGRPETRLAFDHCFYSQIGATGSRHQKHYRAAHWAESTEDLTAIEVALEDGLRQFREAFGFTPKTFVACNYVWPKELEPFLSSQGIEMIQAQRGNLQPLPHHGGRCRVRRVFTGKRNDCGQIFSVRNVMFEPYRGTRTDWVQAALSQIRQAFRFGVPAVICTHRINYTSAMDASHRDRGLRLLDQLLSSVRQEWGDVEFLSSDELNAVMRADGVEKAS